MLQRLREWLVLVLLLLLPFHAFLVTVGTRLLTGPGHAPLPGLVLWKEALLGLVLCITLLEISRPHRSGYQDTSILVAPVNVLNWLILSLLLLGVLVPTTYHLPPTTLLYGFKYTLFPLLLFLIFRRVSWSEHFLLLTSYLLPLTGAVVAMYGILTLFLPESFFTWLGYSDLHSLYLPDGPLAAFQKIEGTGIRRIQSTFSGPNQLGVWLLIPWSVAVSTLKAPHPNPLPVRPGHPGGPRGEGKTLVGFLVLLGAVLFFTFSRAAWMGAAAILLMSVWWSMPQARKFLSYWVIGLLILCVVGVLVLPDLFLRTASSLGHWERPAQAIRIIAAHPLGLGLGSAGPAANRTGDACVFLEEGADVSWAADRPNLCVFRGDQQVQPFDYAQGKPIPCHCPFLPESWYLQVGVELGVIGLLLFLMLTLLLIRGLLQTTDSARLDAERSTPRRAHGRVANYPLLTFLGISVAALFLHAWEDSAVAYTVWILLAGTLQPPCRSRHSSLS